MYLYLFRLGLQMSDFTMPIYWKYMYSVQKMLSDVQVCHQRLNSAFDLLLIFLCSLTPTLIQTPPPNNALLANLDI